MNIKKASQAGFTLVEIMIVVAIIGLLATIAIPNFMKARATAQTSACINNLRQIEGAIQMWATETKQADDAPVTFTQISGYLKNQVVCPSGGKNFGDSYQITTAADRPACKLKPDTHRLPPDTIN